MTKPNTAETRPATQGAPEFIHRSISGPYFRGHDGQRYFYADIAAMICTYIPVEIGRHIFSQLSTLGLMETFDKGTTSFELPFTFSPSKK